jgi:hypothetical protein
MVTILKRNYCCFNVDAVNIITEVLQLEHPEIVFQNHMYFHNVSSFAVHSCHNAVVNSQNIYKNSGMLPP